MLAARTLLRNNTQIYDLFSRKLSTGSKFPRAAAWTTVGGQIVTKVEDGVKTITMSSPQHLNALSNQMYDDFTTALKEADEDNQTKVVAITGARNFFTSGNEFGNFHSSSHDLVSANREELAKRVNLMTEHVGAFVDQMIDFRKPIFALVNGPALGIGVTMLGLCDVVYATQSAYLTTQFTVLGVCPEACSTYFFPRIMGHGRASNLLLLNAKLTPEEAYDYGLVAEVYPDHLFREATSRILKETAQLPMDSLLASKELLCGPHREFLHKVNQTELEKIRKLLLTDDCIHACDVACDHPKKKF